MIDLRKEIFSRLAIIWRRRWLALCTAWIVCLIGWGGVFLLPNQYQSQALVYVDTESLLGPLLKDLTVKNDVQQQVPLIMKTLLSKPNLHKVAVATDLALDVHSPVDEVNLYEKMEKRASVTAQGANLLNIGYTDPNPVMARNVVRALLAVLVDNSDLQNRNEMDKALGFVEKQISSYEEKLRTLEQRIADFKRDHVDLLVTGDNNLSARKDAARSAVITAQGQVAELESRRDFLNKQLTVIPQFLNLDNSPQIVVNGQLDPTAARVADLQRTLTDLRSRFTDKHPDVISTKRQLAEAEAQAKQSGKSGTGGSRQRSQLSNPVYEQMQMRLFDAEQQLALAKTQLASATMAQEQLERQAAANPSVVAQYTDLTREYDVLKKQYGELLVRRESARMSQAVENTSQKIQFRVMEPPNVPVKPIGPKRLIFLAAVLVGSIVVGAGLAFLLDQVEVPITSAEVLTRRTTWPVLGYVSFMRTAEDKARERRSNWRFAGATASLFLVFSGLFLITLHTTGILQDLKLPGIERTANRVG